VIVKSLFLPIFFLSTLACAALVVLGLMGFAGPLVIAGSAAYVIGMFVVTVAGNVPLNDRLDAADAASEDGKALWRDYLVRWTRLNHVRTLACTASMALFVAGME
jgi:uncharacterized membrane protein